MPPVDSQHHSSAKAVIGLHCCRPHHPDDLVSTTTIWQQLEDARRDGYDFITCRIPDATNTTNGGGGNDQNNNNNMDLSLTTMPSSDWRTSIVGVVDMHHQRHPTTTTASSSSSTTTKTFQTLKQMLHASIEWCLHMNIPAMILPPFRDIISMIDSGSHPTNTTTALPPPPPLHIIQQYANLLLSCLVTTHLRDLQIWIPTTMLLDDEQQDHWLSHFYQLLDYHPSIYTLYTLSDHITANNNNNSNNSNKPFVFQQVASQIHMDMGSLPPMAAVQIPTSLFVRNKRGFPTLSRLHQQVLIQLYRRWGASMKILITNTNTTATSNNNLMSNEPPEQLGPTFCLPHSQYLQHLRTSKTEITDVLDRTTTTTEASSSLADIRNMELAYNDVLQSPLQPLADHLENSIYEIFEHDPVKYVQYERAIHQTMMDDYHQHHHAVVPTTIQVTNHMDLTATTTTVLSSLSSGDNPRTATTSSSSTTTNAVIPYIVLVVGAGRGPLVTCAINAFQKLLQSVVVDPNNDFDQRKGAQQQIRFQLYIYAVEKNPNAILYLRSKFDSFLRNPSSTIQLQIVSSDLRYLNARELFQNIVVPPPATTTSTVSPPPSAPLYHANLVVSELLGSFGCNELSPECLETLWHGTNVCSPTSTKSIPCHYTSHIAPVSSMTLYHKVKQQALYPTCVHSTQQQLIGLTKAFETPYVVRPHVASQMYRSQDCWSFTHAPLHPGVTSSHRQEDLERHVHLEFGVKDHESPHVPFMYGVQYGTGYGPIDDYIQTNMKALMENHYRNSANHHDTSAGGAHESHFHHQILPPSPAKSWTCTGLLGTFTADLYQYINQNSPNIQISTHPNTFSTGMFSWFPLYFPSAQPIHVPKFGQIHIDIWRKCTTTKVWYEWMFTVVTTVNESPNPTPHYGMEVEPDLSLLNGTSDHQQPPPNRDTNTTNTNTRVHYVSPIHNPGGRSSYVSLLS